MSTIIKNGEPMITTAKKTLIVLSLLLLPMLATAQVDGYSTVDTLFAELAKINDFNWSITISYSNDEQVVGLAVPLKMTAGLNRIVADSAIYTGGRVESFSLKSFRADSAIQCVLLGMVANLGPTNNFLAPGKGRLATIFVSSLEEKAIEKLVIDTTTLSPNNSLMVIADKNQPIDSLKNLDREAVKIFPAFVVKYSK